MTDSNIKYQRVSGSWAHVTEDGMLDDDPYPDVVGPSGVVIFEPFLGSSPMVIDAQGTTVTVGKVRATIRDGLLFDFQDQPGVYLAAYIDSSPIWWTVRYESLEYRGVPIPTRNVVFGPNLSGVNITALVNTSDIDPQEIPSFQTAASSAAIAVQRAEESLAERLKAEASAKAASDFSDQSHASALGSKADAELSAASAEQSSLSASLANDAAIASTQSAEESSAFSAAAAESAANAADVVSTGLVDSSVTTVKILDSAVTAEKIADGAVSPRHLVDGAVVLSSRQIIPGEGLLGGGELTRDLSLSVDFGTETGTVAAGDDPRLTDERMPLDLSVTANKLANGSVTVEKIADNARIPLDNLGIGVVSGYVRKNDKDIPTSLKIWVGSQSDYNKIASKDQNTLYVVS